MSDVMDSETTFKAYLELRQNGQYREGAIDLLESEVTESNEICQDDRIKLQMLLKAIRHIKDIGSEKPISEIFNILSKYPGFEKQYINYALHRFGEKDRNTF